MSVKPFQLFTLLVFTGLMGCTTSGVKKTNDLSTVYISSDVSEYFNADLPDWANFSAAAACRRTSHLKFLNFENLKKSFGLTYRQAVFLQRRINENINLAQKKVRKDFLSPQVEEKLFYQSKDEVLSNIKTFTAPEFERVHMVWVDPVFSDEKAKQRLNQIFKSDDFFKGHPVMVSVCKTKAELEDYAKKSGWEDIPIKFISAEMFSVYDNTLSFAPQYSLFINEILPGKSLYLFLVSETEPDILKGKFRLMKIKR